MLYLLRNILIEDQDPLNNTVPYYSEAPPNPSITYDLTINTIVNETGHKLFVMNGSPFQGDYNDPILLLADEKNYSYPLDPKWNVVNFGTNSSIRVNIWNNNSSPHVSFFSIAILLATADEMRQAYASSWP